MSSTIHLGTRKGLFTLTRNASGWQIKNSAFLGIQIPMLLPDPRDGTLFAAVEHGHFGTKVHASTDGGATWEERACPTYPAKPDDAPDSPNAMNQKVMPWSLEKIWCLEAGGADQPGVLWCGTIPGGLFKSHDSGQTWSLVESLWNMPGRAQWFGGGYDWPGIHSIFVDPRNSQRVLIAISCAGVWETLDAGETWTLHGQGLIADYMPPELANALESQDPHRMVLCPGAPHRAWIQHHNGIFRSDDSGLNWQRLHAQPSDFGFAVAVHPHDPDTAWFVPGVKDEARYPTDGALCVTRTRDGGKTFEACRSGLPQEHAYHLIYRHCLDVSPDGQTLVMGSTTGSVWVSENGGDHWERISAELPPVYCVRFGSIS